jgi:hypothetical protein
MSPGLARRNRGLVRRIGIGEHLLYGQRQAVLSGKPQKLHVLHCFDNVPPEAWDFFIGSCQPAQEWLKEHKGCILKPDEVKHYRKIILALAQTGRIMRETDKAPLKGGEVDGDNGNYNDH